MEENKIYIVDDKYWVKDGNKIQLLCPNDRVPMREIRNPIKIDPFNALPSDMECAKCSHRIRLSRNIVTVKRDVADIIQSKKYQKLEIIDIDGIHTPVLKKKVTSKDNEYFTSVQINESKRGPQLVIYAGKKGHKAKTQIFVTPETKKMSFDHKDIQPTEIFTKITAQFDDETANEIKKG